jgi:hypothetical protein
MALIQSISRIGGGQIQILVGRVSPRAVGARQRLGLFAAREDARPTIHKVIIALPVQKILGEQIAKKLV